MLQEKDFRWRIQAEQEIRDAEVRRRDQTRDQLFEQL